jgi:hypothetical protein
VRLEVARAVDEFLRTVGEREAWVALLNHQILKASLARSMRLA